MNNDLRDIASNLVQQGHSRQEIDSHLTLWMGRNHVDPATIDLDWIIDDAIDGVNFAEPDEAADSDLFTYAQLSQSPPEQPDTFWRERILFRGCRCLIAGAPKVGKSNFTLSMGVQAACGGSFLGHQFERPLKFMWMQAEIQKAWLPDRVKRVACGLSTDEKKLLGKNLILSGRLDLDLKNSQKDVRQVRRELEHHKPDIWAIDPIIDFSTAEENSNVEVRALLRNINALAKAIDCAVVIVHHIKKMKSHEPVDFDQVRGASAFRGWFDTGVMLTGDQNKPTVSWETRNTEPPHAHAAAFNTELGQYESKLIESATKADERSEAQKRSGEVYNIMKRYKVAISLGDLISSVVKQMNVDPIEGRSIVAAALREYDLKPEPNRMGDMMYQLKG